MLFGIRKPLLAGIFLIASSSIGFTQIFTTEEEAATIRKRAAGIGASHMKICEKAMIARYPHIPAKAVSWKPSLNVDFYRRAGG